MRSLYARALYSDPSATLDDLHEAVTTLEDAARIARRVFGSAHPTTMGLGRDLRKARAARRARLPRGTPSDDLDEVEDADVSPTTREPEGHAGFGILLILGLVAGVIYQIHSH